MSRGSIVILTSLASEGTFLGVGNYIAAKHAVKGGWCRQQVRAQFLANEGQE